MHRNQEQRRSGRQQFENSYEDQGSQRGYQNEETNYGRYQANEGQNWRGDDSRPSDYPRGSRFRQDYGNEEGEPQRRWGNYEGSMYADGRGFDRPRNARGTSVQGYGGQRMGNQGSQGYGTDQNYSGQGYYGGQGYYSGPGMGSTFADPGSGFDQNYRGQGSWGNPAYSGPTDFGPTYQGIDQGYRGQEGYIGQRTGSYDAGGQIYRGESQRPIGYDMRRSQRGAGPQNYSRSDERIKEDICDRLTDDHDVDASNISIEVKQGEVTMTGTVDDRWVKHRVENLAAQVSGVRDVHNQLRMDAQSDRSIGRNEKTRGEKSDRSSSLRQ